MAFGKEILPEFDQEMKVTRSVLERVPMDKPTWKPHAKSFDMKTLAMWSPTCPAGSP